MTTVAILRPVTVPVRVTLTSDPVPVRVTLTSDPVPVRVTLTSDPVPVRVTLTSDPVPVRVTLTSDPVPVRVTLTSDPVPVRVTLTSDPVRSGLPYSVTQEEAMKHGEVARRLSRAIHCLKEASTIFLDEIFNAVDQLPYCLLYSAKVLKQALHDKFPNAPEKDVLKASPKLWPNVVRYVDVILFERIVYKCVLSSVSFRRICQNVRSLLLNVGIFL